MLGKESSPVYGFHIAVLLLNMFNLLPVLTVSPINSQGARNGTIIVNNCDGVAKHGVPGVFLLCTLENLCMVS